MARRRLESAVQAGRLITQEADWRAKLGAPERAISIPPVADREGIFSLQYSFDGDLLAVGYGNAGVDILDSVTGQVKFNVVKPRYGGLPCTSLRFNPKHQHLLYSTASDGNVHVSDLQNRECKLIIEELGNEINCMDFSKDAYNFATAGRDLAVRIYDTKTGDLVRKYEGFEPTRRVPEQGVPNAHTSRVFALRWHTETDYIFITGGWDDSVKIWDARSSHGVVRLIAGPHLCGDALDIRGYRILTGSWRSQDALQIWDYSEGKLLQNVPYKHGDQGEFLYCAQFMNDVCVAAGGSGTNDLQIIDTADGACLGSVQMAKPVQALDTTLGGARVAVGSVDSVIKLLNV